ncbi:hypothetical protein BO78DRAFT_308441 [Aspergillus sclerotiicarbonarius CBS 121057]|uniref:Uncharacterized protein n=1 Tax=Aspergillus sclerotiicarbonarius (strain CBS 121057 / IBT 28362) TaxID=1448318 RepID=A0A319F2D9_ASPSB|nr:hypothetical protein BO78DRAFT_308441 [Aspergillus sclerotiicarbonarius CBS 121057]
MASQVLGEIAQVQKAELVQEYGDKLTNQFIESVKASALFQANWGELLNAAPTALSLMGSCWIASSNPDADMVSLADAVPIGGFKYLTKRANPTLRSCLVDVCNNGGREAFTTAGTNMDALQMRSRQICDKRIPDIFRLIGPCTRDASSLEDFNDALQDFSEDAKICGRLAGDIREAFQKWAGMVGELHTCAEQRKGTAAQERHKISTDQIIAETEKIHSTDAVEKAQQQVDFVKAQVTRAEKRLDNALDKVPGPWETMALTAVNGYFKAMPQIVAAALPFLMGPGAHQQQGLPVSSKPINSPDPAYAAAVGVESSITHFYQYLGGDSGSVDWPKFQEADQKGSGIAYVLGNFTGQRANIDKTDTIPNNRLLGALDTVIGVAEEIRAHLNKQNQLNTTQPEPEVLTQWRNQTQKSQQTILELVAYASALGAGRPGPMPYLKTDPVASADDQSVQMAQVQGAMHSVEIASSALEAAQDNYQATLDKQAKTAAAMAAIELRLRRLQEEGKTLDQIKEVLRDCLSVLADLSVQINRLERFFTMLSMLIDQLIIPTAADFTKTMIKTGKRLNDRILLGDITKQSIFMYTLQTKGYFSLLQDISSMYTRVHRDYIANGVELCLALSKPTADRHEIEEMETKVSEYTARSTKGIARLVADEQEKIIKGLSERASKAQQTAHLIGQKVQESGLAINHTAKLAIEGGAKELKIESQSILAQKVSLTVVASEEIDANDF